MRYREEELIKIYKNPGNIPENSCILWLDCCTLFPYRYDNAEVFISLDGTNIVHSRELLCAQKLYINIGALAAEEAEDNWIKAKMESHRGINGIPVIFPRFTELEKVQTVTCSWVFSYRNDKCERNKIVVHTISNITFNPFKKIMENGWDYMLSNISTSIPALLEKQDIEKRRKIIESYEEIYQGKAELNVHKRWEVPIYASIIRTTSNAQEPDALETINKVLDYLLARNLLDNCNNVFLNVFFDNDKKMLQPMIT